MQWLCCASWWNRHAITLGCLRQKQMSWQKENKYHEKIKGVKMLIQK